MKSEKFAENITIETEDREEMVENNMDTNNINDDTANNSESVKKEAVTRLFYFGNLKLDFILTILLNIGLPSMKSLGSTEK